MKKIKWFGLLLVFLLVLAACGEEEANSTGSSGDFLTDAGKGEPIRIVAGSEVKIFEPILEEYAKKSGHKIQMDYLGSLDIMRMLRSGQVDYDAVWPASSLWLNLGDSNHLLKYTETTSITPVIFGIKESLAKELGFVGKDVYMKELMEAIDEGKLQFAMTSATQSNSGASAYLAFLTAMSDSPEDGLTKADLNDQALREKITKFLAGVNRSSGSSNWLVDLFLMNDYDAMVNYEQLIIQTNMELQKQGKEPLYAVYPVDGLSISDSPLAYVDKKDEKKEELFLDFQKYILSKEAQEKIEKTGKRNAYGQVAKGNQEIYKKEWGIDADKLLAPIRLPQTDVIEEFLSLYQSSFKKPAFTIYVLDYSGSMEGEGKNQMLEALNEVLIPENAQKHLLMGTSFDKTILLPFAGKVWEPVSKEGNDLTELYNYANDLSAHGGTSLYEATVEALQLISSEEELNKYNPAIVVLSDGKANGRMDIDDLKEAYQGLGMDIPIFSIMFGSASEEELDAIAELTHARVFDGRKDLVEAFRSVKGYN